MANEHIDDDEPLDPAVERVRRKLARLMLVSVGTLGLGVLAILAAVVWRSSEPEPAAAVDRTIGLLPGASLRDAALDGNRIAVTIDLPNGATEIVTFDMRTGAVIGRLRFERDAADGGS